MNSSDIKIVVELKVFARNQHSKSSGMCNGLSIYKMKWIINAVNVTEKNGEYVGLRTSL